MGTGIAQVAASAMHPVLLYDISNEARERAMVNLDSSLERKLSKGLVTKEHKNALLARITPCNKLEALADASIVIEAVAEKLEIKRTLFHNLESITSNKTVYASNTSSISITAIGAALEHPQRLVGMHFFNPATRMRLVEVISGLATEPSIAQVVFDTAIAWGKNAVHAKSTPGFIVNRVARPYYAEALRALQEGAGDAATLDAIMREAGKFRMGPFELMDLIGHDINYSVTQSIYNAYHQDARFRPSLIQQELVHGGLLGRKSGRGFYDYTPDAPNTPGGAPPPATSTLTPRKLVLHGNIGPLEALVPMLEEQSVPVARRAGNNAEGWIEVDGKLILMLTDGRSATECSAQHKQHPVVLVDLALDYISTPRVAVCCAEQNKPEHLALVVGLFHLLKKEVSVLDDFPAMMVMRTLCMLANEGADAVYHGVCSAEAVDTAMLQGLNYPVGPLTWAQEIGVARVVQTIEHIATTYGEDRYRVSPWLKRKLHSKSPLL